jgi:hypothetical protein
LSYLCSVPAAKGDLSELEARLTKWVVSVVAIAVGISTAVLGLMITIAGVLIALLK